MLKKKINSQAGAEGVKILGIRSIKKQEWGFSVGQPILIYALVGGLVAGGVFKTIYDRRMNYYPYMYFTFTPNTW